VCVCVCVCGSGKPYVMGTKCPHKDCNIQNPCPSGDIFWSPTGKQLISHSKRIKYSTRRSSWWQTALHSNSARYNLYKDDLSQL